MSLSHTESDLPKIGNNEISSTISLHQIISEKSNELHKTKMELMHVKRVLSCHLHNNACDLLGKNENFN